MSTRQPINIDPLVRDALRLHLVTRYAGSGVGYSEFIRRALVRDGAVGVPERVQPDDRWSGTHMPSDLGNGPVQENAPLWPPAESADILPLASDLTESEWHAFHQGCGFDDRGCLVCLAGRR